MTYYPKSDQYRIEVLDRAGLPVIKKVKAKSLIFEGEKQ